MKKSFFLKAVLIILTVAVMTPTGLFAATEKGEPQSGGVLKIIGYPPPVIGYPPEFRMGPTNISVSPCLESLSGIDKQGQFIPTKLCTGWELSQDGKAITLSLRKGVKFHDGTDFNAAAVKWNLDKAMERKSSAAATYESIEVVDDYTVKINITHFQNDIIGRLPYIVSPTAVEKNGIEWARVHPVGTGPFKFVRFERDVSLTYERFDGYWGGKPYLDGVEFLYLTDPMVQSAAMQRGDADVIHECGAKVASELISQGFKTISLNWIFLSFLADSANEDSPFANKKIREALEFAVDKKAIVNAVGYGQSEPMGQISPPSYLGFVPDLAARPYDPEKAKKLLAEAGYPKGFSTKMYIQVGENKDAMVAIQGYLEDIGIKAEMIYLENPKWIELGTKGWHNGIRSQKWGLNPLYSSTLNTFLGKRTMFSASVRKSPELLQLIDAALRTTDFDVLKKNCQTVVKHVYDEALVLPLWSLAKPWVLNPSVHDTGFFSTGSIFDWTPEKAWIAK